MRALIRRLRGVPHLFSKLTVAYCVAFASVASVYALRTLARTGHDPAALLVAILGFFGGELLCLCLRSILKKEPGQDPAEGSTQDGI